ncbi:unnamed protein product [Aureobasidium pullulans]|nr:unnamed protein product [Aureobasidium pullulans]CAD0041309.1 unnamed protein product [Aureobasidium pullulans]CAD0042623.1 unnamed protein product [Aureobasidium pullulans]
MARINQRPSETPTARSSNLPAAPSVAPSSPNLSSDKENHSTSAPRDKGKGRMSGPPILTLQRGGESNHVLPPPSPTMKRMTIRASTTPPKTSMNARR